MTPNQKRQTRKVAKSNFTRWSTKRQRKPRKNEPTHQEIETAVAIYLKTGGKITQEKVPTQPIGGPAPSGVDNFLLGMS